jgi:hypothetical protein
VHGATVMTALLGVRRHHLLRRGGRGPSLHVSAANFHGGGGGARHGPVKQIPPSEVMRIAWW